MKLKKLVSILITVSMVTLQFGNIFAEPTEDFHIEPSTEPTESVANPGPVVEEYMVYVDDDKRIEPGSLSGDVNLSTVGKGLYYDGNDFYFFLDTGIMATNFMHNIEGDRFYFGDNGKMVKDELITYDGELYYFDVNGAMYKNRWYTVEELDTYENTVTYTDYYFGPTGRAYRAGDSSQGLVIKTIEEMKYGFNSDGEKVEGYYDHAGTEYDPDEIEAYANCEYFFDPAENGAAYTGWHYYPGSVRGEEYDDNEEIVLYFDEKTCKKVKSNSSDESRAVSRMIEGQRYMFDHNGVRKNKWYVVDPSRPASHSNIRYFSDDYDGYLSKGWFLAIPPENSILEINRKRHNDDEEVWFYAGSNGSILRKCVRKIGNYTYAFDDDGVMQEDCMVRVRNGAFIKGYETDVLHKANILLDSKEYGHAEEGKDITSDPIDLDPNKGLLRVDDKEQWMYFLGDTGDDDKVGAMCRINSPVKIELNDADIEFVANSTGGYTVLYPDTLSSGVAKRNNKLIQNGVLLKPNPDDNNYGIVRRYPSKQSAGVIWNWRNERVTENGETFRYYVVNSSGAQVSSSYRSVKDKQGNYIYFGVDGEFLGYYSCQGSCSFAKEDYTYMHLEEDGTYKEVNIVKGDPVWKYKIDGDWIQGLPPERFRVDVKWLALNFLLEGGFSEEPYKDGIASYVYSEPEVVEP